MPSNSAATTKRTLTILPEESSLRASRDSQNPFLDPVTFGGNGDAHPPRALRALARIVDGGLCHRCGSCVGICPTGVLATDGEEYPRIEHLSACTDCDLCVKVCPGDEFAFESFHSQMFGTPGDLTATHGTFERGVIAYSTEPDVREHSTSGGLVTAILLDLMERCEIDGAVVIGSDPNDLWKGKPFIARSRAEILSAMKSKYAISPTNVCFSEIRETPGRYALVGLPCQVHGYRKAAELDARLAERVVLSIGLFCHAAVEHEAFRVIWSTLGEKAARARRFISRVGKHPGTPYIELDDGSLYPVYFGARSGYRPSSIEVINVLYRLYTPTRCTTCFDSMSDFADISVGDPWMAPPEKGVDFYQGWSFALLRTARGVRAYDALLERGKISGLTVTTREIMSSNRLMATEKRWRAFRVIETHRRQGKPIPSYGDPTARLPEHTGVQFVKTELHMLSHIFCFLPGMRAAALRFFLGSGGYWLFWLNSKRRWLRTGWRDFYAALRRTVIGRS